jgi:hypothetical protein
VNVAYRSIKVTKLFSGSAKAQIETSETSNVVYEYDCVCPDFHTCETKRVLDIRIRDHQAKSRNTKLVSLTFINTLKHVIARKNQLKNLLRKISTILQVNLKQFLFLSLLDSK